MKSGSSSLTTYLSEHPQVFMASRPKEPSHFVDGDQLKDVYPSIWEMGYWKSEARYLSLFSQAIDHQIVGEASQNYTRLPRVTGVPARIAKFNPNARFLYILRDPIERTISHYWYMVNHYGEGRPMFTAITEDSDYTSTSYYAMQISAYIEFFGMDRIKIITLENLRDQPLQIVQEVFNWLGVDKDFVPPSLAIRTNTTPDQMFVARGFGLLHRLRYSTIWSRLGPTIPAPLRKLGRDLAEKSVKRSEVDTTEVENWLRPLQLKQTKELTTLTEREFPEWRTLYTPKH